MFVFNSTFEGQMIYMDNWKMIMFLGTPVMPDLNSMINTGLYINDLSMHDFSRDLMLAGTQQSVELKLALDQEQQKSKKLEESMRKLDEEMRRTDELLYQMIPKQVADRLRRGENPIDTCEVNELRQCAERQRKLNRPSSNPVVVFIDCFYFSLHRCSIACQYYSPTW